MRIFFRILVLLFISIVVFTIWANLTIIKQSKPYITDNIHNVPSLKVGLLLGTSKTLSSGQPNAYFFNRIEAAVALYKAGKIQFIIASGDNSIKGYDEASDMKEELIKRGVPADKVFLDYAGFRTFDSVIRAREIFGQSEFIIISQEFHNQRAVYIARKNDIQAWGFNAQYVHIYHGFKTQIREILARDKVFIDRLLGIQPKFLGEKVIIK